MQLWPLKTRVYSVWLQRGGLHAPQSDLDFLSTPTISLPLLFFFLILAHVGQGTSYIHVHIVNYGAVQNAHSQKHVRCMLVWTTPLQEYCLSPLLF